VLFIPLHLEKARGPKWKKQEGDVQEEEPSRK